MGPLTVMDSKVVSSEVVHITVVKWCTALNVCVQEVLSSIGDLRHPVHLPAVDNCYTSHWQRPLQGATSAGSAHLHLHWYLHLCTSAHQFDQLSPASTEAKAEAQYGPIHLSVTIFQQELEPRSNLSSKISNPTPLK